MSDSYTSSYTDNNNNIGALFTSPLEIISWNNFGTYVADLSLNEDPTTRADTQMFTVNVDQNLVVNGDTMLNGNVGIGTDSPSEKLVVNGDTTLNGIIGMPNNVKIESKEYFGNSVTTPSYAWDFRNNTGINDIPDIINGKNAKLYGAYSTYDGMVFDGSDSYIQLDSWETGGEAFSVEAYVKYDSFNNWSRIFDFGDGDGDTDASGGLDNIALANTNTYDGMVFGVFRDGNPAYIQSEGFWDISSWQHIVTTVDQYNFGRIYKNGTLDSSGNLSETNKLERTNHYIGKSGWSSHGYFDGTIAYFRWWKGTALSADEVVALYKKREALSDLNFNIDNETLLTISKGNIFMNTSALDVSGDIYLPNNVDIESKKPFGNSLFSNSVTTPVTVTTPSYAWDFRNNTGTSDVPDIINGKIATLYGGAYSTYDGMVFDGSDSYIRLDSWETGGQAFSVEALVKYDSFNDWSRIFDFGDGESDDNIVLANKNTTTELEFQVYKDADIIIGGGMGELDETTGTKWQHIVATVDQDNTARVYIDASGSGIEDGSGANAVLTRTNHYIGKSAWPDDEYFHGTIAYFRWWDGTALSADEVAVLSSNRESSLKESLNFNIDNERTLTINKGSVELIGSPSYPILNLHTTSEDAVLQKWTYVRDDGVIRPMKLLSRGHHYIQGHLISTTGFTFQTPDHFDFYTDVTKVCTMTSSGDFIVRKSATIEGVLYLDGGTADENSVNVIEQDRTNTYIKFKPAGTRDDWAYLRQIGDRDEIMLALDFHDNVGDAGFVIRELHSNAADEDGDYQTNVRFKVDRGGNVGIGLTDPAYELDVAGNIGIRGSGNGIIGQLHGNLVIQSQGNGTGGYSHRNGTREGLFLENINRSNNDMNISINILADDGIHFNVNDTTDRMYIKEGGVGIGTTSILAPLHVVGQDTISSAGGGNPSRRYFNYSNDAQSATKDDDQNTNGVSIYAQSNILTSAYIVAINGTATASDERIKKNIIDLEDDACLQQLNLLKPKRYNYKDAVDRGTDSVVGFIAQEVQEIIPSAVKVMSQYIPNIYCLATVNGSILEFASPLDLTVITNGGKIKIYDIQDREHFIDVSSASTTTITLSDSSQITEDMLDENQIFVYGEEVPDFCLLKKEMIIPVAVGAIQELDRQVIQIKQEKDALQTSHDGLQASHDSLQANHDSLKDELTQLKTLLQSKGIID